MIYHFKGQAYQHMVGFPYKECDKKMKTMGCVECRQKVPFDELFIYDGMFVCEVCFEQLTKKDGEKNGMA